MYDGSKTKFGAGMWVFVCEHLRYRLPEFTIRFLLPPKFFDNESLDRVEISASPIAATKGGEICQLDFNAHHVEPLRLRQLQSLLVASFPPFFERVGDIECRESAEGLIILLRQDHRDGMPQST